jgi:hypothetical protein
MDKWVDDNASACIVVVQGTFEDAEAMTTSSQSRNLSEAYSDSTVVATCLPCVQYMCLISGLELTVAVLHMLSYRFSKLWRDKI